MKRFVLNELILLSLKEEKARRVEFDPQVTLVKSRLNGRGKSCLVRWTPRTGQLGGLDLLWPSPRHPPMAPGPIHLTRGHISE
jgi:hypothetical protein